MRIIYSLLEFLGFKFGYKYRILERRETHVYTEEKDFGKYDSVIDIWNLFGDQIEEVKISSNEYTISLSSGRKLYHRQYIEIRQDPDRDLGIRRLSQDLKVGDTLISTDYYAYEVVIAGFMGEFNGVYHVYTKPYITEVNHACIFGFSLMKNELYNRLNKHKNRFILFSDIDNDEIIYKSKRKYRKDKKRAI